MTGDSILLAGLRASTRGCHAKIEAEFNFTERVRGPGDYAKILRKLYGFYLPLEKELEKWKPEFERFALDFEARRKLHLLREDLQAFGLEKDLPELPVCEALPDSDSFLKVAGCLYVLEGSTLGGQILFKHFSSLLKINPQEGGLTFYRGYGALTGKYWQEYRGFLARFSDTLDRDGDRESVYISAQNTFARLGGWLQSV